ncbi:MAG: putative membrane protein YgcG [Verrucomicrobiales bacterium]|jgi:uncharacterized membrane protein YgcG
MKRNFPNSAPKSCRPWEFRIPFLKALVVLAVSLSSCWEIQAEITDTEASAEYLAEQIASSSGGTAQQYMSYSRGLAKTLSQLTPVAQQRVLESSVAGGGESSLGGGYGESSGGDGDSESEGGENSAENSSNWWDRFWAWLRGLFS